MTDSKFLSNICLTEESPIDRRRSDDDEDGLKDIDNLVNFTIMSQSAPLDKLGLNIQPFLRQRHLSEQIVGWNGPQLTLQLEQHQDILPQQQHYPYDNTGLNQFDCIGYEMIYGQPSNVDSGFYSRQSTRTLDEQIDPITGQSTHFAEDIKTEMIFTREFENMTLTASPGLSTKLFPPLQAAGSSVSSSKVNYSARPKQHSGVACINGSSKKKFRNSPQNKKLNVGFNIIRANANNGAAGRCIITNEVSTCTMENNERCYSPQQQTGITMELSQQQQQQVCPRTAAYVLQENPQPNSCKRGEVPLSECPRIVEFCKKPCSFLLRGQCRKEDCAFSHDLREVPCRFFMDNLCFKQEDCPFMHYIDERRLQDHVLQMQSNGAECTVSDSESS